VARSMNKILLTFFNVEDVEDDPEYIWLTIGTAKLPTNYRSFLIDYVQKGRSLVRSNSLKAFEVRQLDSNIALVTWVGRSREPRSCARPSSNVIAHRCVLAPFRSFYSVRASSILVPERLHGSRIVVLDKELNSSRTY
jgi:hypothetical protein